MLLPNWGAHHLGSSHLFACCKRKNLPHLDWFLRRLLVFSPPFIEDVSSEATLIFNARNKKSTAEIKVYKFSILTIRNSTAESIIASFWWGIKKAELWESNYVNDASMRCKSVAIMPQIYHLHHVNIHKMDASQFLNQ